MKYHALFLLTALVFSSSVHGQLVAAAPPPTTTPDLHLAGTELIKSAEASKKSLLVALGGGLFTSLVAIRANKDQLAPVAVLGGLTALASITFSMSAISHKRKAGLALRPAP